MSDEVRLVALARSFAPPNARVRIVKSYRNWTGPVAEVVAEYDVEVSVADLKLFNDKSFEDKGWKQCSPGTDFFGPFLKKYVKGYDSAQLKMPREGTVFSYELDFRWQVPGSC